MIHAPHPHHPTACHAGRFLCTLPTLASLLHLAEVEVWTLIVAGRIAPVGKTDCGELVFDAIPTLRHRTTSR